MYRLLLLAVIFIGCKSQPKTDYNFDLKRVDKNSIFGPYAALSGSVGSGITLYPDSLYTYSWYTCLSSATDTGKFSINDSILTLTSFFEKGYKEDEISSQTGRKILLKEKEKKNYYYKENNKYDLQTFWLKITEDWTIEDILDSTGCGYATIYYGYKEISDDDGPKIKETGEYMNFKLVDGFRYSYSDTVPNEHIEIIEGGVKLKDSVFDYSYIDKNGFRIK